MIKGLVSNIAFIDCDITHLKRENIRTEQLTASINKPQVNEVSSGNLGSVRCAAKLQNGIVVTSVVLVQVALCLCLCVMFV